MSTSVLASAPSSVVPPTLAIYGLDDAGKPHASVFAAPDAELAEKAAGLMGMRVLRLAKPEHLATVAGLPQGRVFASGRAFVPFVKRALYDRLTALGGLPAPKSASRGATSLPRPATIKAAVGAELTNTEEAEADEITDDRDAPSVSSSDKRGSPLAVGTVVLAPELVMSWWEAVVVAVKGDAVTLRWRDFPEELTFKRKRSQLAQIPDDYVLPV